MSKVILTATAGEDAFLAVLNSVDQDVTGNGTKYALGTNVPLLKLFDYGDNLDTSGAVKFTAPEKGVYYFYASYSFLGLSQDVVIKSTITGPIFPINEIVVQPATSFEVGSVNHSVQLEIEEGQSVNFFIEVTGLAGDTADLGSSNTTYIYGYRVA